MKIFNELKLGYVRMPVSGHNNRGSGSYYNNLKSELSKINEISISEVDVSGPFTGFDIIHFPYFDPFFITLPLLGGSVKVPSVVTVHDLIPLKYPAAFPVGLRGNLKWQLQKNSLARADRIITDSSVWKPEISRIAMLNIGKIDTVYLGVSRAFRKIVSQEELNAVILKYSLPPEFILYVGDVNYNKNISLLLAAFQELTTKYGNLKLILVGNGFTTATDQLREIELDIKTKGLESKIIRLSGLKEPELCALYNLSELLIMPSLDEGFGLPVLEAFACGTPVLASRIGSIEEISAGAALLVSPQNPSDFSQAADEILGDKNLRNKLIASGFNRVKEFTWQKTAGETFKIYKKVLSKK